MCSEFVKVLNADNRVRVLGVMQDFSLKKCHMVWSYLGELSLKRKRDMRKLFVCM